MPPAWGGGGKSLSLGPTSSRRLDAQVELGVPGDLWGCEERAGLRCDFESFKAGVRGEAVRRLCDTRKMGQCSEDHGSPLRRVGKEGGHRGSEKTVVHGEPAGDPAPQS